MNPNSRESKKHYFKQLETAITLIFSKKHTTLKFEECYRSGYNIVQYHSKDELITFYKNLLQTLLTQIITQKLSSYFSINETDDVEGGESSGSVILSKDIGFLIQLGEIWSDYQLSLNRITSILLYLDNRLKRDKAQTLYEIGLMVFYKCAIKSTKLDLLRLIKELIKMEMHKERKGEFIERNPLINTTQLFIALSKSFYEEYLESYILEFSKDYYKAEGKRLDDENLPLVFINAVYKFINDEKDRCNSYLASSTLPKLLSLIDDECLTPYLVNNIKNETVGLKAMLEQNAKEDLSKLFFISIRVPDLSLPAIVSEFKSYLLARGSAINSEIQEKIKEPQLQLALKWTENFLNLTHWADKICEECFQDNLKIIAGCNEAFIQLINSLERAPEFISLFIDYNMREDFKRKGDSNIEPILDNAVNLFRFLEDKDIFEKYYKTHLAKRLLTNSMSSAQSDAFQDSEKIMITKLQAECGFQFTMKIEGMFKDVQYSSELTKRFKESREKIDESLPFQFNLSILTNTFWPISSQQPVKLNDEMSSLLNKFSQFYKAEFSGRKLEWITQFGSGEVKMNGAKDPHDLIVNSNQLIVLMLFNDEENEGEEGLSYEQILSQTQLEELDLQRTLQSLSCDKFKFNSSFTNPQYKIKIPMVSGRIEGSKELLKTREEIDETRKYLIDASIVRTMKDRKVLSLNLLIVQVTGQLKGKFKLSPNQIKLRIESLVEREYLIRDEEDRTLFKYLA